MDNNNFKQANATQSQFKKPFIGFKHLVGSVALYKTNGEENQDSFGL